MCVNILSADVTWERDDSVSMRALRARPGTEYSQRFTLSAILPRMKSMVASHEYSSLKSNNAVSSKCYSVSDVFTMNGAATT